MISNKIFYAYGKEKPLTGESSVIFNNSAETLTMQVDELAGSVELYGTADFDSNIFYKLTGNNLSFELVNKITTDGIYHFSIEGIAKIKFVEGIVPKYGAQLPDPTNGAYKVGCSFLNTTTGGLYVLVTSGSADNRS